MGAEGGGREKGDVQGRCHYSSAVSLRIFQLSRLLQYNVSLSALRYPRGDGIPPPLPLEIGSFSQTLLVPHPRDTVAVTGSER